MDIPILPDLQTVLDATPSEHLTFLVTEFGKPFTAAGFGNWFRDMCVAAGLPPGISPHGLRKAAATRFANHGATAHELMAWFGWKRIIRWKMAGWFADAAGRFNRHGSA